MITASFAIQTLQINFTSTMLRFILLPQKTEGSLCLGGTSQFDISELQSVHFAGSLDAQNILLADTGISRKTEGHLFGDHLILGQSMLCHGV
jgi:hypothetical protein